MTDQLTRSPRVFRPFALPGVLKTILCGGAVVALLDAANATTFWYLYRGIAPRIIFQSIAAGLYGKPAFAGGAHTVWVGVGLHCVIAFGIAAVYCLACGFWPGLLRKPVVYGAVYGLVAYLVMNHVVVPLSHQPPGAFRLPWFLDNFLGHILLVGPPVALIASRAARDSLGRET